MEFRVSGSAVLASSSASCPVSMSMSRLVQARLVQADLQSDSSGPSPSRPASSARRHRAVSAR